jgi:hypothetical protein
VYGSNVNLQTWLTLAVPESKGSASCFGHVMLGDIDSVQILQIAGLATELVWVQRQRIKTPLLPGNKPVFQCQTTCWLRYQSKLQGTKKLKCKRSVIGHPTPTFSWSGNICLHSSPQTYSCFGQHATVFKSYLLWITLSVEYHQKH